jgi:hypothetical protein
VAAKSGNSRNTHWWAAAGFVLTIAAALADRGFDLGWWKPLAIASAAAATLALVGWRRPAAVPACILIGVSMLGSGSFVAWVAVFGWGRYPLWVLLCGTVVVLIASLLLPAGRSLTDWCVAETEEGDSRPRIIRDREARLRRATRQNYVVTAVTRWPENPNGGERIHVELPDGGTVSDLQQSLGQIQAQLHLLRGCVATVLEGETHQGEAILDVMHQDVFSQPVPGGSDTSPASINDRFEIGRNARGVWRHVCFRIESMIVGGSPGSGKTTLLRRIIMHLARCTDALIWVVDMNGGGVAEPFVSPWLGGKSKRPAVDWVAPNPHEAAVLLAAAREILKGRKRSTACIQAKRAANTNVLPVSSQRPAIVVIGDEGAEVEELPGLLGLLVSQGITKIAEIGRAEAGRVIHSVLRGVADAIDKTLRANARMRLCARMNEHGEYSHILDRTPPKTQIRNKGTFWARIATDDDGGETPDLELLRGSDATPATMEAHTIAVARLRPELDAEARQVIERLTLWDVLGIDPDKVGEDITDHPAMQDAEAGRAYSGRWDRYRAETTDVDYGRPAAGGNPYGLDLSELDDATAALHGDDGQDDEDDGQDDDRKPETDDDTQPEKDLPPPWTRVAIEKLMRSVYPEALGSKEIGDRLELAGTKVSRQTRQVQLKSLTESGVLAQPGGYGTSYVYRPQPGEQTSPPHQRNNQGRRQEEQIYRPGQPDDDYAKQILDRI